MSNPTATHNWQTGVLPTLSLAPKVTTPLIGSVLFGLFENPPVVPYIHGPAHSGKHAIAAQAAELRGAGIAVVDDTDPRRLAEAIRSAYNGMVRLFTDGSEEKAPELIAVSESSPTAFATRVLPLHLEHPIPLDDIARTLRTRASHARQAFGAGFREWLTQQDHDELYDRYLDTWTDSDTEDRGHHSGRTAAAYGLTLLGRYLEAEGVDHDPSVMQLPDPHTEGADEPAGILTYLRDDLLTALEAGSVQLLNSAYATKDDTPIVGKLSGDRVLLLPQPILRNVLHPATATIVGLGYELERQGFLKRRDSTSDVRTVVTKIDGKAQRAWDVDATLFGGSAALGGAYDLEYFTRTNTVTPDDATLLSRLLLEDRNILITGLTNSGKTLLLEALKNTARKIAPDARRAFFDDLLDGTLNSTTFIRMSINEHPFVAVVTARTADDGVSRYASRIPAGGKYHDFAVVHIEREGTTWKLDIDPRDSQ